MTYNGSISFVFYLFMLFGCTPSVSFAQIQGKSILIRPAKSMETKLSKPNAVLMITGEKELKKAQEMLDSNNAFAHKCGTQWFVSFWDNPTDKTDELPINLECEKFERHTKQILSFFGSYINEIEGNAALYMYNIKVPAEMSPDELLKRIGEEQTLYFIYGNLQHLPSITFRITENTPLPAKTHPDEQKKLEDANKEKGKIKLNDIIALLDSTVEKVAHTGRINYPLSGIGDGQIEDVLEVTLKFDKDAKIEDIAKWLTEKGVFIQDKRTPSFYFVQLLSSQKMLTVVKDALQTKYDFLIDVYDFPNRK